jgi:phosphate transport system permease protein
MNDPIPQPAAVPGRLARRGSRHVRERVIEAVLLACALVAVATTLGIVFILVKESLAFFAHVPVLDFLTDTQWTPLFSDPHFGILVLLSGTLTSSAIALLVAVPLGTVIAIYLSEFAAERVRETW